MRPKSLKKKPTRVEIVSTDRIELRRRYGAHLVRAEIFFNPCKRTGRPVSASELFMQTNK